MGLGVQPQQEHFAIYTLIYVWKQYFQLLNWHKIVIYIIILKTANLIINWLLWCHMSSYGKTTHTIWPNMKARGQKFQFSNFSVNWGKFGNVMKSQLFKNSNFPSLYEMRKTWKYTHLQIYTYVHSKLLIFNRISPCSSLFILHAGCLWISEWKIEEWKGRKNYFFVNSA